MARPEHTGARRVRRVARIVAPLGVVPPLALAFVAVVGVVLIAREEQTEPVRRHVSPPVAGRGPAAAAEGVELIAPPPATSTPGASSGASARPPSPGSRPASALKALAARDLDRPAPVESRLRRLDELVTADMAAGGPEQALRTLERFLQAPVAGTPLDAMTLRLGALAHVGHLRGEQRAGILVAHARDPRRPRPERLLALELLAGRLLDGTARSEVEVLARGDADTQVQRRARWALEAPPRAD